MNVKLKQAMDAISQLPEDEQERIAALILEELADDAAWDQAFQDSQPALKRLAEEAMEEYRAGKTEPLDPDLM